MADTLEVKIDTARAKENLDQLKTAVRQLGNAFNTAGEKTGSFDKLTEAFSKLDGSKISGLQSAFQNLASSASQFSSTAQQLSSSMGNVAGASQRAGTAAQTFSNQLKSSAAEAAKNVGTLGQFSAAAQGVAAAMLRTGGGLSAATGQFGQLGVMVNNMLGNFNMLTSLGFPPGLAAGATAATAAIALLVAGVGALIPALVETINKINSFKTTMDAIRGAGAGQQAFAEIAKVAQASGQSILDLLPSYKNFDAAAKGLGITMQESTKSFQNVSNAMRIMGVSGQASERVLQAFQQMASKGTIQMEELKQQMGEQLPIAIQAMAKALGVTTGELQKMLEAGGVSSAILPRFSEELYKMAGGAKALEAAMRTIPAQMQNINNAFTMMAAAFDVGFFQGFSKQIADGLKQISDALNNNAGFKTFAAAVGELAGALGGILLSAIGVVVQILGTLAGALAPVIGLFAGIATAANMVVQAILSWAPVQAIFQGMSAAAQLFAAGVQQLVTWVQQAASVVSDWFNEMSRGNGVMAQIVQGLSTFVGWVNQALSVVGGFVGLLAGFVAMVGVTSAVLSAMGAAWSLIVSVVTPLAPLFGLLATAIKAAAVAGLAFVATPLGMVMVALAAAVVAAYAAWKMYGETLDAAAQSQAQALSTLGQGTTAFQAYKTVLEGTIPPLKQLQDTAKELGTNVSNAGSTLTNAAMGMSQFADAAAATKLKLNDMDQSIQSLKNSMSGLNQSYQRDKDASRSFNNGIDQRIAGMRRQEQLNQRYIQDMQKMGVATDFMSDSNRRLHRAMEDLEQVKKNAALADADAEARHQREVHSVQEAIAAEEQKKQKLQQLAEQQKHYTVTLDEAGIAIAREKEAMGLGAAEAGRYAQAMQVATTSITAMNQARQTVIQEGEANINVMRREIEGAVRRNELLIQEAGGREKLSATANQQVAANEQIINSGAQLTKQMQTKVLLNKAMNLSDQENITLHDALKRVYDESSQELRDHVGSQQQFVTAAEAERQAAQKAAVDQTKLRDATSQAADAANAAAEKMGAIKATMDGIGAGSNTASAGITRVATAATESQATVTTAAESFNKLGAAFKAIATNADGLATSMTTIGTALGTINTNLGTISETLKTLDFKPLTEPMTTLSVSIPPIASGFTTWSLALSQLGLSLPLVKTGVEGLNEVLPTLAPTMTQLGTDAINVGTGFQQFAEALPAIQASIEATKESLPQFAAGIKTIGDSAVKLKEVGDGMKSLVSAIDEVMPKVADFENGFAKVKGAMEAAKTAVDNFVKANVEELPKAQSAMQSAVGAMNSSLDSLISKIDAAIQKYKELAAAAASSSAGGGGGDTTTSPAQRYGGMAGDSSFTQTVSSSAFDNAPQFRDGTANTNAHLRKLPGGGIPSILHPNEAVVPLPKGGSIPVEFSGGGGGGNAALDGAMQAINELSSSAATMSQAVTAMSMRENDQPDFVATDLSSRAQRAADNRGNRPGASTAGENGAPAMNINFNITTPDADSFKRSEPQIRANAYKIMREAYERNR